MRLGSFGGQAFSSLKVANYRRYYTGQSISQLGDWIQMTAISWLVLTLTRSSTDLGIVAALQTLPILLIGPYGGVIADRASKRRLLIGLQAIMLVQTLALGLLTIATAIRFWEVCLLAATLGATTAFDVPARQSFLREVAGPGELRNAIALNSVTASAARAAGATVSGLLLATTGASACFLVNAGTYAVVMIALLRLDTAALRPVAPAARERGQLREGVKYAARIPHIAIPLAMTAVIGTFAYEFQTSLPVLARVTFHGGPVVYGLMTAAMGVGAVAGGLVTAARGGTGLRRLIVVAAGFGLAIVAAGLAPALGLVFPALALVGWGSVSFLSTGNTTIQVSAEPRLRGRLVALWQVGFQGTTPVGAPFIGWVIARTSPRVGLVTGGVSCLAAAAGGLALARWRSWPQPPADA